MAEKHIPLRRCTGCGEMKPKRELIRIVKSPEDDIAIDITGKKSGRGAYICKSADCLKLARKAKRLERSLDCTVPAEVYDSLETELMKI